MSDPTTEWTKNQMAKDDKIATLKARVKDLEGFILSRCYCQIKALKGTCSYCKAVNGEETDA